MTCEVSTMSALKKEDILNEFDDLIKELSREEKQVYAEKVISIKKRLKNY